MTFKCPICKTESAHKGVCYNCRMTRKDEYQDHIAKLEKKRKYRQGDVITTIDELINCEFVYWNDKIYHRAFIQSLQLSWVLRILNRKGFKYAIRKELHNGNKKEYGGNHSHDKEHIPVLCQRHEHRGLGKDLAIIIKRL